MPASAPRAFFDLLGAPDIEPAFLALAVGVERAGEGAAAIGGGRGAHLAQQPGHGLADALFVERFAGLLPGERQQLEQGRVVVEHLLEMRHQPGGVGGVAREAAAQVIVDAALAHAMQRQMHGLVEALVAAARARRATAARRSALAETSAPRRCRHSGDRPPAAGARRCARALPAPPGEPALRLGEIGERRLEGGDILLDPGRILAIGLGDGGQHLAESGPAPAILRREIGAAPERLGRRASGTW